MSVYSNYLTESFKQPLRCLKLCEQHSRQEDTYKALEFGADYSKFQSTVYQLSEHCIQSQLLLLWIFCRLIFSKSLDRISSKRLIFNYEYETINKQDLAITLFCFRKKEDSKTNVFTYQCSTLAQTIHTKVITRLHSQTALVFPNPS